MTPKSNRAPLLYYAKLCASFQIHMCIQSGVTVRERSIQAKLAIFCPMWPWNLMMSMENNKALPLYNFKIRASFQSHRWIEARVNVWKRSIQFKIGDFLSCLTLIFDRWPWKTIRHLFCTTWSFVHYFKAIGEFKLELQSWNTQFGSKSPIFCPVWPWNLTDDLEKQYEARSMLLQALYIIS